MLNPEGCRMVQDVLVEGLSIQIGPEFEVSTNLLFSIVSLQNYSGIE